MSYLDVVVISVASIAVVIVGCFSVWSIIDTKRKYKGRNGY